MALDYIDAKNQLYIPAILLIVGVGITKPAWLPFAFILAAALVYLKLQNHSNPPLLSGLRLTLRRTTKGSETGCPPGI